MGRALSVAITLSAPRECVNSLRPAQAGTHTLTAIPLMLRNRLMVGDGRLKHFSSSCRPDAYAPHAELPPRDRIFCLPVPTELLHSERMIRIVWSQFGIAFSALLPLINPLGSALVFYGLVGAAPPEVYRRLARRIAINTVLFLLVIELIGAALLAFFGISLPIVEVAGGLVLASMGWSLLNQQGAAAHQQEKEDEAPASNIEELNRQTFYPLTFPITAGPGCIVIMLT